MIYVFAFLLGVLPVSGWYGPKYWIMPCVTMGAFQAASLMKTTRASVLDVTRQDYISTARAKGLKENRVVYHHMLINALIPHSNQPWSHAGAAFGRRYGYRAGICGARAWKVLIEYAAEQGLSGGTGRGSADFFGLQHCDFNYRYFICIY